MIRAAAVLLAGVLAVACQAGPPDGPQSAGGTAPASAAATRAAASAPVLGVSGTTFTVNGTPRFLLFLSYFDGVRRARTGGLEADLAYLAQHVDGIRVLPNWWASTCPVQAGDDTLIDVDGQVRTDRWRELERLLDAALVHGLLVDLSFTRESVMVPGPPVRTLSHEDYERALVTLAGSERYLKGRYPNVMLDLQNEWTRFASQDEMESVLAQVHAADEGRLLAASVSGGSYVPIGRTVPTMVAAYHDPRGADWFLPEVLSRLVTEVRAQVAQPLYLQEPMPISSVCSGQIVDGEAGHFIAAAREAQRSGAAAWTLHTRTTFELSKESLVEKLARPERAEEKRAIEQIRGIAELQNSD